MLAGLASVAAGAVNALAGGGTLITFPVLTAMGIPAVAANITNTIALCPGYLAATVAQSKDLRGQKHRLWILAPGGILGGIAGGILLVSTGEHAFRAMVPFLILLASGLLAIQDPLRKWILHRRPDPVSAAVSEKWAILPAGLAAVYGGYFGAGLSVILLATLGMMIDDSLTRLNALKQALAFLINIAAAVFLVFSRQVLWPGALVMAAGALVGGALGGRLAGRVQPATLRWTVVVIGVLVAAFYLVR